MANSRYEYVRDYELPDSLLPGTFILVRVDGHAFKKYRTISLSLTWRSSLDHTASLKLTAS